MEPWRWLCRFTAVLLIFPRVAFPQSAGGSGSQSLTAAARFQILDQKIVFIGQHPVTFNRVAPPVPPVATPAPSPSPVAERQYADYELLVFSATVYDGQYTVIDWSYGDQRMVAVSNINFDYFSTLYGFAEGETCYENLEFLDNESSMTADAKTATWLAHARAVLPTGVPSYVIVSGTGSTATIQGLDALHRYFGANESSLVQAYSRQQAQFAAEQLQLRLHPPVKPNTVINYWPIKSSLYRTSQ